LAAAIGENAAAAASQTSISSYKYFYHFNQTRKGGDWEELK